MIKKLLRKFGYIHKDELIKQAVDLYLSYDGTHNDEIIVIGEVIEETDCLRG